jgi:hypothetical protein
MEALFLSLKNVIKNEVRSGEKYLSAKKVFVLSAIFKRLRAKPENKVCGGAPPLGTASGGRKIKQKHPLNCK